MKALKVKELKPIQIIVDGQLAFGWIDVNCKPTNNVALFLKDEEGKLTIPLDGIYIIPEYSYSIKVVSGIIQ